MNTSAVIHINEVLDKHATNVWNVLGNFIPIAFAVVALEKAENNVDTD